jgi:hypothetical protein
MRPLVRIRRSTPFDPAFLARSPLLWPLEGAAGRLRFGDDFPSVDALARVFATVPPVRFVPATPRARRRQAIDAATLYDGRITLGRCVPTRAACWHDLMNALVWGTFPAAKRALHERQHRAIAARLEPGARVLPPRRTPELDALALLDEGGVIVLADDPAATLAHLRTGPGALHASIEGGRADAIVFGHAIFESLVLGVAPTAVAAAALPRDVAAPDPLGQIDAAFAAALGDPRRFLAPGELCRVDPREAETLERRHRPVASGGQPA